MKSLMTFLFILLCSLPVFANSEGDLGIGAMIGNPVGVSAKYWLGGTKAVDGGLGFSIGSSHTNLSLHSDFLLHN